jgi:hypothetical protein
MEYIKEYSISSGLEGIHMQYMIEYIRNTCCNIIYLAGSKEYPLNIWFLEISQILSFAEMGAPQGF